MPKKENNRKNHIAREARARRKREGRPKQVWVWDEIGRRGHWEHVDRAAGSQQPTYNDLRYK